MTLLKQDFRTLDRNYGTIEALVDIAFKTSCPPHVTQSIVRVNGRRVASAVLHSTIKLNGDIKEVCYIRSHSTYQDLYGAIFDKIQEIHSVGSTEQFQSGLQSIRHELKLRAYEYMSSKPGWHELGNNVALHNSLTRLLRGQDHPEQDRAERLLDAVLFRLSLLQDADEYRRIMGIDVKSIKEFAIEGWILQTHTDEVWERKEKAFDYLKDVRLLDIDHPPPYLYYSKPMSYLSIALAESCESWDEIKERVDIALKGME